VQGTETVLKNFRAHPSATPSYLSCLTR